MPVRRTGELCTTGIGGLLIEDNLRRIGYRVSGERACRCSGHARQQQQGKDPKRILQGGNSFGRTHEARNQQQNRRNSIIFIRNLSTPKKNTFLPLPKWNRMMAIKWNDFDFQRSARSTYKSLADCDDQFLFSALTSWVFVICLLVLFFNSEFRGHGNGSIFS